MENPTDKEQPQKFVVFERNQYTPGLVIDESFLNIEKLLKTKAELEEKENKNFFDHSAIDFLNITIEFLRGSHYKNNIKLLKEKND